MKTVALLFFSNIFMTFAWYGHLRDLRQKPLWVAILVSLPWPGSRPPTQSNVGTNYLGDIENWNILSPTFWIGCVNKAVAEWPRGVT